MSGRGLLLLAALAALAVGGLLLVRWPAVTPPAATEAPPFLPGLEAQLQAVEAVAVRGPDGRRLARLERRAGAWVVANRRDYPADLETLRGTLIGLARARRLEPKTDRAAGHARLGVAAPGSGPGAGVEVRIEGPDPTFVVLIGEPASGDVDGTYVRRAGQARAWLVSGALGRHEEIGDWLDERLVDIAAIRVHRVRIEPVDGEPVRVLLPSQDAPRFEILDLPAGREPLSRTLSKSIARGVAELRLVDVVSAAAAEPPPRLATARFETFGGLVIEIEALAGGRQDPSERLVRLRVDTLGGAEPALRAQARRLNARFDGWLYRIPDYKFINLTYTLEHVLAPADGA